MVGSGSVSGKAVIRQSEEERRSKQPGTPFFGFAVRPCQVSCSGGKLTVPRAGEVYDARIRDPKSDSGPSLRQGGVVFDFPNEES